jgi:aspartate/methionine/tyrosine aminotransferase
MAVDISGCADKIPQKYFEPNVNYESDPSTLVLQMQFPKEWTRVPLDFALCRWLAVENGLALMPLSNFCLHESSTRIEHMVRIAICKDPKVFDNP